jgi:hypothetical protein
MDCVGRPPVFALTSEAITKCVPGAQQVILQNVNHDVSCRDPAAFADNGSVKPDGVFAQPNWTWDRRG